MTGKTCDPIQRNGSRCGQGFREKRHRKNTIGNWGKSCERKCMDSVSVEKLHFIKGNCYIELKDYANAVLELQAAVRLQGAGTESYRSLAIALANDGKLEEAQQELDTLQKKGAFSGDCDLVAAEILSLQKNYDQALALYTKVFNEVEDLQLLSHAYLSAANIALNLDDMEKAVRILKQGCQNLPEGQAVLQKEMLADLMMQQAASDKENAENCYASAVKKYRQAQANGTEDTQMAVLKNLIDQLRTSGWLK